ncbi:MBL fold metallo-hydrolase [Fictibacillus nanhaiensis]|uniref:MBL fold metallo-hydrolase n=1 Tax=Fictibacillus nanhaiensis TaxID=742169 RepID=UPI001C939E51|nr:MBL fold metallo-hydrolase [Fictibacillus nanhaiensis]MBY6036572.1 MBL fold metallo-hydrolase [Fictibacillus nanhaiensis]
MLIDYRSNHFELHKMKEGIYAAISKDGGGAVGNAGFIDLGNRTIVFDTFNTQQAAMDLKHCAEELTNRPVSWVVNSHYHGDHIRGNQVFLNSGILSSEQTYKKIKEVQPSRIASQKQDLEGLQNHFLSLQKEFEQTSDPKILVQISFLQEMSVSLPTLELTLPSYTFKEEFTFHGNERTAKLFTWGPAHSPCDAFLYLPEDEVLFMGDLLFVNTHASFFDESDLENWKRTLGKLETWSVETVVPGHGPIGTKSDLKTLIQYIQDIEVLANCTSGGDQIEMPMKYKDWSLPQLFMKNINHIQKSFEMNRS